MISTVELAQKLIRFKSDIQPETEERCAYFLAEYLRAAGFEVAAYDFAPGRTSLIATMRGSQPHGLPLAFTGHLDVVPAGGAPWNVPPFEGVIRDGRLYGRGACDMKAGIATFVNATIESARAGTVSEDVVLIITAGEETGCEGAFDLAKRQVLPELGALIVAEPTGNLPIIGHKGCLRMEVSVHGRAAHTSMPHLGENAIEKALAAITRIMAIMTDPPTSGLLGPSTLSVSTMSAGSSINVVPDRASFTLCARTVPLQSNADLIAKVRDCLNGGDETRIILDLPGIETEADDRFVGMLRTIIHEVTGNRPEVAGAPYGTDAAALTPGTGNPPTVVIGPGLPSMAHQTDEYCDLNQIEDAQAIYRNFIARYGQAQDR